MSVNIQKLQAATLEEFSTQPEKFGFPTSEEFLKNPEKWLGRKDDRFAEADKGAKNLDRVTKRIIHEIEGYRCKGLEEVQKIAENQGIPIEDLDYKPMVTQAGAGKYDIIVRWVSKAKRAKWA